MRESFEFLGKQAALSPEVGQVSAEKIVEKKNVIEERQEQVLSLIAESAAQVLSEAELQERFREARDSIQMLPDSLYRGAYYEEFRTEEGLESVPAFVRSEVIDYGSEEMIGKIVIREGDFIKGKEAAAILLHELTHKFGPKDEIFRYPEVRHNESAPEIVYTTEKKTSLGPLYWKDRDIILLSSEDEVVEPGMIRFWETIEKNYKEGELRLWEAITDWESTRLLQQAEPGYEAMTGYWERALIKQLVDYLERRGEAEVERSLKQGLYHGDRETFEKLLEEHYGNEAYEKLRIFMAESERLQKERINDVTARTELYRKRVITPFKETFLRSS